MTGRGQVSGQVKASVRSTSWYRSSLLLPQCILAVCLSISFSHFLIVSQDSVVGTEIRTLSSAPSEGETTRGRIKFVTSGHTFAQTHHDQHDAKRKGEDKRGH